MSKYQNQGNGRPTHQDWAVGVIYTRYSSHSQRDVSIEQQIRACRTFAERNCIDVLEVYEDRALTGTNDKRPGFQKMIQDAQKSQWNYVIVYTLDRFARDRYDSAVYKRELKNAGVKVLSAMENISDDPTGVLMESLLEGLAEYYSKELSRKIQRGQDDNARKCLVNGSLPLGYTRAPDGRYQISEPEAELVREIYQRVKEYEKLTDIIADLNKRGLTTKMGKPWNRSSFNKLLSNERYVGTYIYRNIRVPGGIPQIISQELFDEVQCILHLKPNPRKSSVGDVPQKRRRDNGVYLLTGKLFCGHCKSPMTGLSGTSKTAAPHFYYTCKGRRTGTTACDKRNVRRQEIERFVATALRDTMLTDEAIRTLADAAIEYQQNDVTNNELETLKNQLTDVDRSLNNLLKALEAGIFSTTTQERITQLETQKRDLTHLIAMAQAEEDEKLTRSEIIAILEQFQHGDVDDKDYQEVLIDTFLVAAYLYDDRVKFVFTLGEKRGETTIPFEIEDIDLEGVRIMEFGGAEGNRTPVRKQLGKNFSGRSLLFTFPQPHGNKHPYGISSFIMRGTLKALRTHVLHSDHTRARLVDLPGRMGA